MAHQAQLRGRLALVATDIATYGMARMTEELVGDAPVQHAVFTDVRLALAWLGHPALEPE
ncbi:MAG: hypothetical protein ACKVZ0_17090 [Gemmatimonadales bacterium]